MIESKLVKRTHELMTKNNKFDIAIDATVGNGYDTLFLANYYKKVIGIDIQELAIKRSREKVKDLSNVELYLEDFNNIDRYNYANLIVFNLGFLPGSNKKIKTQDYTSNEAILKAYSILDGTLIVACYIQHEGGYDEYIKLINTLESKNIDYILEDDFDNKEKLIIIYKEKNKMSVKNEFYTLSNGVKIPMVGLGTWQTKSGEDAYNSVKWALEAGYRHIDTAYVYGNEKSVGEAIKDSNISRNEIFVTTKCPAEIKTYEGARKHFYESLENLNTDYIDLYLIHAPWPWSAVGQDCTEGNIEVWKAMIEIYNEGKVKAIGVSNFHVKDIIAITEATGFKPMVNQIRFFIGNTQEEITKYCQSNDILIQAYSPLATGEILGIKLLEDMANKYNTTIAKLSIRYCIERGTNPLPKSIHENRIYDNIDLDFTISEEDMNKLNQLNHICSTRPLRS
jgi:diketogulonate reductase-like aldo/keto reductase